MTITPEEVAKLAAAATPGPWWGSVDSIFADGTKAVVSSPSWGAFAEVWITLDGEPSEKGEANAAFIAAAHDMADLIERQAKLMDSLASALRAAEQSIVDFIGVTDARQHSGAHHILDEVQSALDAYRTLIDTDTLARLEARDARMKAEGARMERDKIYRFMQHMDSEGKAYAEQILAALAQIKGKNDENN